MSDPGPESLKPLLDELGREARQRSRDTFIDWVLKVVFPATVVATGVGGFVGGTAGYIAGHDASRGGTIAVTSKPAPARVTVDGRIVGKTPIEKLELDPGSHAVVVEALGYEPWIDNVKVKDGSAAKVHAELVKATPTPAPKAAKGPAPSYSSRAAPAPMPTRNCSSEQSRCESGCRDAKWRCESSCPYCGSCVSSMTWEQCRAACDSCRQSCKQNSEFCEQGCRTQYDICRGY